MILALAFTALAVVCGLLAVISYRVQPRVKRSK